MTQQSVDHEPHTLSEVVMVDSVKGLCTMPIPCLRQHHHQRWEYRCSCGTYGSATQAYCYEDVKGKAVRNHAKHSERARAKG
jgi:hypothetical protein